VALKEEQAMNNHRSQSSRAEREALQATIWARRRDIPIAILAWLVLGGLIFWALSYIVRSLLVFIVAALLSFALTPAVKLLQRIMPRVVAVIIVYIVVLSGISMLFYAVVTTSIGQIQSLGPTIPKLLTGQQLKPTLNILANFGITTDQLKSLGNIIAEQAAGLAGGVGPLIASIADFILNIIIVAVLSIYLLLDGERAITWMRKSAPLMQRTRIHFFLDTLERVIGGYIRGQIIMSSIVGLLVGVGMAIFGVPYAVLLGVVAFILEFAPIIGTILSGVICVLLALTKGWIIALLVLAYFVGVHIVEGDILAPRIVGKAVGVHPAVSLVALLAGAELFGVWGAVLGAPIAGLIQAVLLTVWQDWRMSHPEQFPIDEDNTHEDDPQPILLTKPPTRQPTGPHLPVTPVTVEVKE
jgi:predicted PurR-regulated permease PerM